jgi:hyaluronate lyase
MSLSSVPLLFLAAALWTFPARADDFDDLRVKWWEVLTGGTNYDLNDALVRTRLQSITNTANTHWNSMDKSPTRTYLWSDLTSTTVSAQIVTAFSRLRAMALAYSSYGSSLRSNVTLAADIQGGLEWMYANRYNETKTQYDNWYHWEIGAPLQITDIAVLMHDGLGLTGLGDSLNAVEHFTPSPTNHGRAGTFTGANLADRIRIVAVRGAVVKNPVKISTSRDALSNLFPYVTSGDGFYVDGSFIQHNRHPYTGSYGSVLLANLSLLLPWLQHSPWDCVDPARQNVIHWIYDAYEPLIYRGAMMDMTRGRAVSRSGSQDHAAGHNIMQSILRLSDYSPPDRARIRNMLKYWAQSDTFRDFLNNAPLPLIPATRHLLTDPGTLPRGELVGHWTFGSMDRVVHLRPGWGFGLSLSSSRVYNYESINGENLRGWFHGDGLTYLYTSDLAQFSEDFWPTVDSYRLPGTTVDTATRADGSGQGYLSSKNWAGGATLGNNGSAGMELAAWGSSLTARKSWFMFENEVACLGAGITATGSTMIQTTVENRRLASNTNVLTIDGVNMPTTLGWSTNATSASWCALSGVAGYVFPGRANVKFLRQSRTASWSQINTGGTTASRTRNYLTIWVEHGTGPANAAYAYITLPNSTAAQTSAYASNPDVRIIENSSAAQAVRKISAGIVAANFWNDTPKSADLITCNRKAAVITHETPGELSVAVADPTQANSGTISVLLNRTGWSVRSADLGITVQHLSPTIQMTVNVNGAAGRSFVAHFELLTQLPTISAFTDRMIDENTSTGPIAFTVGDDVTAADDLIVSASSSETNLLPAESFVFGGSGSNRFLTVSPAPNQSGVALVTVSVWDGQRSASNSFQLTITPANRPPVIEALADVTLNPGETLAFTVPASDPDAPPQKLSFQLLQAPAGVSLDADTGAFLWRPLIAQAGSSNHVQISVTDDGIPSLSATQSFAVLVRPAEPPAVGAAEWSEGRLVFSIDGQLGPDYQIEASSDLIHWTLVFTTNSPSMPFQFEDAEAGSFAERFYRVRLAP